MIEKKIRFYLFLFPVFCLFGAAGIEYKQHYSTLSHPLTPVDQLIHIIEIDPTLYEIKPAKALDDGIGRESVLSISTRHGAIGSVNGGFFAIGGTLDGRACGALKIHDWYALPFKPRGCIGWSGQDQIPKIDRLLVNIRGKSDSHAAPFSIQGLNRERKEGEAVLFTPSFHKTTLTPPDGEEITIVDGVIQKITKGGSAKIPENGFILSIQTKSPLFNFFSKGQSLAFTFQVNPLLDAASTSKWERFDYIVGGTPILIHNGTKVVNFEAEQTQATFLSNRHSRTAVGILSNGHWIFVVADKTDLFDGMTIPELTDLMKELGCVHALNLDGGGSSTLVYEGSIKNSPHGDEDEGAGTTVIRRVSDALIIRPRN